MTEALERDFHSPTLVLEDNPLTTGQPTVFYVTTGSATFMGAALSILPNSTEQIEAPVELRRVVDKILSSAREEVFEDGIMSQLANGLIYLIEAYGEIAVQELARRSVANQIDNEVASEALQWMGRINYKASHKMRLWLLERSLFSNSLHIRDSAGLGIASLNDPAAIPSLRRAILQEKVLALREDLEQVLNQLEGAR